MKDFSLAVDVGVSNRPVLVDSLIVDQSGDFSITLPVYWNLNSQSVYRLYFVFDLKSNFFDGSEYYQIGLLAGDSST